MQVTGMDCGVVTAFSQLALAEVTCSVHDTQVIKNSAQYNRVRQVP